MKQQLDAIREALAFLDERFGWSPGEAPSIDALRNVLSEFEQMAGEPVADINVRPTESGGVRASVFWHKLPVGSWLVYATPPSQQPQAEAVPPGYVLVPVPLLEKIAPEQPMNQDEMGGCVWCAGTPPGKQYGYAGDDPSHHEKDCPWVGVRVLITAAQGEKP